MDTVIHSEYSEVANHILTHIMKAGVNDDMARKRC
jgi:hypothetical protein